jgi:hypothetical protein
MYLAMSLSTVELRLRAGVCWLVRSRGAAFADGLLMMIIEGSKLGAAGPYQCTRTFKGILQLSPRHAAT